MARNNGRRTGDPHDGNDVVARVAGHVVDITRELNAVPLETSMQLIEFCRRRLDAAEASLQATRFDKGARERDIERDFTSGGQTSKAEAKKRTKRAMAVNANPDLADKLATGTLSTEQADVIADAAAKTDGKAATDDTLIDKIANSTPEQGRKAANEYVNSNSEDTSQALHDRARRGRKVYKYRKPGTGRSCLVFEGDDFSIDQAERVIRSDANHLYNQDGGRDLANDKHPRTDDQRRFDAGIALLTGKATAQPDDGNTTDNTATTSEATAPPARTNPAPATNTPSRSRAADRRATVFVKATLDQATGSDNTSVITSADGTVLPPTVVERLACGADFIGQIYSAKGELLWQGRKVRYATPAQINGLIARDGGCVRCGAHHDFCIAHHLKPYNAPIKGESNIDELALVCDDCHDHIHDRNLTLHLNEKGVWKLRPATAHERPPKFRPPDNARAPRPKLRI